MEIKAFLSFCLRSHTEAAWNLLSISTQNTMRSFSTEPWRGSVSVFDCDAVVTQFIWTSEQNPRNFKALITGEKHSVTVENHDPDVWRMFFFYLTCPQMAVAFFSLQFLCLVYLQQICTVWQTLEVLHNCLPLPAKKIITAENTTLQLSGQHKKHVVFPLCLFSTN